MKGTMKTTMETMRLIVMTMNLMMKTTLEDTVTQAAVKKTKNGNWSTLCN